MNNWAVVTKIPSDKIRLAITVAKLLHLHFLFHVLRVSQSDSAIFQPNTLFVHSIMRGGHVRTVRNSFSLYQKQTNDRNQQAHSSFLFPVFHLQEDNEEVVCEWTDIAMCVWENATALPCVLWENSTVAQRKKTKQNTGNMMCLYSQ